jgi:uncharacterized protein
MSTHSTTLGADVSATVAIVLALIALGLTALSLNISRLRLKHKVSFGDGGHKDLLVAVRAHGNALEQSMLFAVLLLAAAVLGASSAAVITGCCSIFVAARIIHAAAMFGRWLKLRQLAHLATLAAQTVLALSILYSLLAQ